jgi:hypothetical protein
MSCAETISFSGLEHISFMVQVLHSDVHLAVGPGIFNSSVLLSPLISSLFPLPF